MSNEKYTAIILAAGKGRRMGTDVPKQYLELDGHPILFYAIEAFEKSPVQDIVLVTGDDEIDYCKEKIVKRYGFSKIRTIVTGGKERYHSVYEGLRACENTDYVLIHDGARPFVNAEMIQNAMQEVKKYDACVCAVPAKDTIKISDENNFTKETPDRKYMWIVQTPQTFSYTKIKTAYERMLESSDVSVTDDAMVMEQFGSQKVKLIMGDYNNIKITTPDDLIAGAAILKSRREMKGRFKMEREFWEQGFRNRDLETGI